MSPETCLEQPSYFLPEQLERIQGYSEFAMCAERAMTDRPRSGNASAEGHRGVFILRGNTGSLSHLLNGLLMLRPGGSLLVLQPPKRYSSVYKDLTDRDGQKYGFVVGAVDGGSDDFTIAVDEVEKTLDLMA